MQQLNEQPPTTCKYCLDNSVNEVCTKCFIFELILVIALVATIDFVIFVSVF